jgi:hypothetical protein
MGFVEECGKGCALTSCYVAAVQLPGTLTISRAGGLCQAIRWQISAGSPRLHSFSYNATLGNNADSR